MNVAAHLRIGRMRSSMNRARSAIYPPVPNSFRRLSRLLEDPQNADLTSTLDGDDSLYSATVGPEGAKATVFVSNRTGRFMRNIKEVFADAPFTPTPTHPEGCQVYQIVAKLRNTVSYYQSCWCLLSHIVNVLMCALPFL